MSREPGIFRYVYEVRVRGCADGWVGADVTYMTAQSMPDGSTRDLMQEIPVSLSIDGNDIASVAGLVGAETAVQVAEIASLRKENERLSGIVRAHAATIAEYANEIVFLEKTIADSRVQPDDAA